MQFCSFLCELYTIIGCFPERSAEIVCGRFGALYSLNYPWPGLYYKPKLVLRTSFIDKGGFFAPINFSSSIRKFVRDVEVYHTFSFVFPPVTFLQATFFFPKLLVLSTRFYVSCICSNKSEKYSEDTLRMFISQDCLFGVPTWQHRGKDRPSEIPPSLQQLLDLRFSNRIVCQVNRNVSIRYPSQLIRSLLSTSLMSIFRTENDICRQYTLFGSHCNLLSLLGRRRFVIKKI